MLGPDPMNVEEHLLLQEVIEERFGLGFTARDQPRLESRLRPRLRELHLRRYIDYYLHLKSDPTEMARLAALITNNETYFFRETYQFDGLFSEGLDLLASNSRSAYSGELRAVSVGCSSGEEAYTLSIYAYENRGKPGATRIRIDGFDLDEERLALAKRAVYSGGSLRSTTPEQCSAYFEPAEDGQYELRSELRQGVSFRRGNLLDTASFGPAGSYDVLLCRNVLIYFSEIAFERAIENFARALRPGGLLFLGHSESLIGRSTVFDTVRLERCIAYRRGVGT